MKKPFALLFVLALITSALGCVDLLVTDRVHIS